MAGILFIAHHGKTELDGQGRTHGWIDAPIENSAKRAIQATALKLYQFPMRRVVTSDLLRTAQTADIIADRLLLEVEPDFRLRPWDMGEWSGLKVADIRDEIIDHVKNPTKVIPGGESFEAFVKRFKEVWDELIREMLLSPEEHTVIVTHSWNIALARYFVTGDISTLLDTNSVPPGGLTSWRLDGKGYGTKARLVEVPLTESAKEKIDG